jgi:hypothetical protein
MFVVLSGYMSHEGILENYSWMRCAGLITDSEGLHPCTDCCGTHMSDNPVRAL